MSVQSKKKNPSSLKGFYSPHSSYEKIIEKGMEKYYYGRESKGPGAYLNLDVPVNLTEFKKGEKFSIARSNRGLLSPDVRSNKNAVSVISDIGPTHNVNKSTLQNARTPANAFKYEHSKQACFPSFGIPKASRDYSFSKYSSLHSNLVRKGLY